MNINRVMRSAALIMMVSGLLPLIGAGIPQTEHDCEDPAINYYGSTPANEITELQHRLDNGDVHLEFNSKNGYLSSVLHNLKIPLSSQLLVFSKTSFQRDVISPRTPRALYFNERTYIGWVPNGSVVEVAAQDPKLGTVFYTLNQQQANKPKFERKTDDCLQCHDSNLTRGVPGLLMRSVYTDHAGQAIFSEGSYATTDESPLKERWGGWYVTGKHGLQRHMGNQTVESAAQVPTMNLNLGANITSLEGKVDTNPYLAKTSDIAALMVAEHQTHIHNLITRASYETRRALRYNSVMNEALDRPGGTISESTTHRIEGVGESLLQGILMVKEQPLTSPITGTSKFKPDALKDSLGRSLADLDLKTRLFRYPCSFLIYSPEFDSLPILVKEYIYRRLFEVLSEKKQQAEFSNLSHEDRQNILKILLATKPDFTAGKNTLP